MSTGPHLPVGAADDTESTFSTVPTKCKKFYFIFQRSFEKSKMPGFLIENDGMKTFYSWFFSKLLIFLKYWRFSFISVDTQAEYENRFQRAMAEGDYEFLKDLPLDELVNRKSRLDIEMDEEIRELRRR